MSKRKNHSLEFKVKAALEELIDGDVIPAVPVEAGPQGGRRNCLYSVNSIFSAP